MSKIKRFIFISIIVYVLIFISKWDIEDIHQLGILLFSTIVSVSLLVGLAILIFKKKGGDK